MKTTFVFALVLASVLFAASAHAEDSPACKRANQLLELKRISQADRDRACKPAATPAPAPKAVPAPQKGAPHQKAQPQQKAPPPTALEAQLKALAERLDKIEKKEPKTSFGDWMMRNQLVIFDILVLAFCCCLGWLIVEIKLSRSHSRILKHSKEVKDLAEAEARHEREIRDLRHENQTLRSELGLPQPTTQ